MTAPSLTPNTRVIHRTHPEYGFGLVRYVEEDAFGEVRLQVAFDHLDGLENVAPDQLDVIGDPLADAAAGRWGEIDAFRRKLTAGLVIGENNLNGGFTKAAVQPLPHQAFVLDKVLSADRFGHVLADDVGLGKTIEAGLLITCLMRREPPQRILVVCPAGLAIQWQDEMDEHFGLPFSIMGDNFDGRLAASWRTQPLVVAPLDRLKREEYRELLQQVGGFDLVVCDEAHRLTAQRRFLSQKLEKTANYRLFEFLVHSRLIRHVENNDQTPRSPRLLLLSATPHQGDDERFVHLLKRVVQVFNLRVPDSWDQHISTRILERLEVIQSTMALAGPAVLEDYREMILGQVAEQVDASRLFAESQAGHNVSEAEVDEWVCSAVQSVERWRGLFGSDLGLPGDASRLKPSLTSEHFKAAYRFACEHQGIRFRETRNSANQFVPEVFNFDLPAAFRDPVFRPSRTVHVVFDRDVYAAVRGQDLGTVRGQPIRPLLTGFGEPFTDWLFQTAMHARPAESAFSIKVGGGWTRGSGWLFVFALRWLGKRRRLSTTDSLALAFAPEVGPIIGIPGPEAIALVIQASDSGSPGAGPGAEMMAEARAFAQRLLRDYAANRDASARSSAGLSLLSVTAITSSSFGSGLGVKIVA